MEDQGKRLLLGVAVALGVLLLWQMVFPPKKPDVAVRPPAGESAPVGPATSQVASREVAPQPDTGKDTREAEQVIALTFPRFSATFSNYGGVVKSWHLTDPRY